MSEDMNTVAKKRSGKKKPKLSLQAAPVVKATTESDSVEVHRDMVRAPSGPHEIDIVLSQMLSNLPLRDLINCRSVCTKWNDHASSLIIRKGGAEAVFHNKLVPARVDSALVRRVRDFSDVMKDCQQNIFLKYTFRYISMNNHWVQKVLKICGPNVKELTLEARQKPHLDAGTFSQLLIKLSPTLEILRLSRVPDSVLHANRLSAWCMNNAAEEVTFPRLKAVILPYYLQFQADGQQYGSMWKAIFAASPNVKKIEISNGIKSSYFYYANPPGELMLLKELRDCGSLMRLTKLRLDVKLRRADVELLTMAANEGMSLEKLVLLQLLTCYVSSAVIQTFLQTQSRSLKSLILANSYNNGHGDMKITLPRMECLEFLCIVLNVGGISLENLDLSLNLPRLKSLQFRGDGITDKIPASVLYTSSAVENFKFSLSASYLGNTGNDHPGIVTTLGRLHPFVKSLTLVNPSQEQFAALHFAWPNLKYLEVTFSEEDEFHRLGWNNVFAQSGDFERVLSTLNESLDKSSELLRRFPVLWKLNELEKFVIDQSIYGKENSRERTGSMFSINTYNLRNHSRSRPAVDHCKKF